MKTIIISPYSRVLHSGKPSPKDYPIDYWNEVIKGLKDQDKDIYIIQIGVNGEQKLEGVDEIKFGLPLKELKSLVLECDIWVSVDNFFHHLCWLINKPGIVIFSITDPLIFGHDSNENLLVDRKYLRKNPFIFLDNEEMVKESFINPTDVINKILKVVINV